VSGTGDNPAAAVAVGLRDVSVTLGGNRILKNVSVDFGAGVTSGLIGPNGAGKTTLLNYICGIVPSVSGTRTILGRDATALPPHDMIRSGLARTFQGAQFVGELTAVENVMLGYHIRTPLNLLTAALRTPGARRLEAGAREAALAAMERAGIADLADRQISQLSFGNQKKVDLARALVAQAPCILLDEPMAGLSVEEKDSMCAVLTGLRDSGGPTIIIVEHDMRVVGQLCVRTAVLDAGELIAEGPTADVLNSKAVIEAYMGGAAQPTGEGAAVAP
jgi:ABC-type branched-subunit amino acid transport system ATPase component